MPSSAAQAAASDQATKRRGARVCIQTKASATSAYMIQAAREPANRIGINWNTKATTNPRQPQRRRAATKTNGDSTASTGPSLRLPAPKMPESRSAVSAPARLQPVRICTQASSSQSTTIAAQASISRGHHAALRNARQVNSANGRKRNSAATVLQDFSGATAPGAEMSAASQ